MVPKWRFFASCIFSEQRQLCPVKDAPLDDDDERAALSDLHSKFALGPHHV